MSATTEVQIDERLVTVSTLTRLLRRPELGALMGAVVIYAMFAGVDTTGVFATSTAPLGGPTSPRRPASSPYRSPCS